jgi:hypothetical protein
MDRGPSTSTSSIVASIPIFCRKLPIRRPGTSGAARTAGLGGRLLNHVFTIAGLGISPFSQGVEDA